ncbi:MAG: VOC family protein [Paracoccaceae bacterium]|nr:VOC family protein [Paracoccaceae bacterium]MDE2913676.1 VOC family protein [Paracoccaceae bacterium]
MTNDLTARTCLWFNDQALPAAEFYCSILPDSRIEKVSHYPEGQEMAEQGSVMVVAFTLAGTPYLALNGGSHFVLDEAVSIAIETRDQAETDRLWAALADGGGREGRCGWLKDRFGLSWQVVPRRAVELLDGPASTQVWRALMTMDRIVIAELETAARGS